MTVEFSAIVSILLPIFAVIVLGYILRRGNFPGDNFWQPAESLTYYVLFPALLVQKIATAADVSFSFLPLAALLPLLAIGVGLGTNWLASRRA